MGNHPTFYQSLKSDTLPLDTIDMHQGRFCTKCKSLCFFYDQGLSCSCDKPWVTEVVSECDYPGMWIVVNVTVETA